MFFQCGHELLQGFQHDGWTLKMKSPWFHGEIPIEYEIPIVRSAWWLSPPGLKIVPIDGEIVLAWAWNPTFASGGHDPAPSVRFLCLVSCKLKAGRMKNNFKPLKRGWSRLGLLVSAAFLAICCCFWDVAFSHHYRLVFLQGTIRGCNKSTIPSLVVEPRPKHLDLEPVNLWEANIVTNFLVMDAIEYHEKLQFRWSFAENSPADR